MTASQHPERPEYAGHFTDLSNHFLVAMPAMADPNFSGTVVYLAEHSPKGALGIVVNRVLDIDLGNLFERISLKLDDADFASQPVFAGGPVQNDRGFVLHSPAGAFNSSIHIGSDIALTSSKDVLEALAEGKGPRRLLMALGYAGWGEGQLEEEIAANAWLTVPARAELMFDVPVEQRFHEAFGLLGIHPVFLSSAAGHA
ncbi:MAG: YqgE/AlgH family protein [Betaproteobacteria bacterium]|nr:YqgE/AlgH family protein [Betaproteobacteria bacterium]NCX61899.1 YqgE/AlgH family protein [Betaproteobacteria bacterium]NCZ74262.1 YqgE/AlgH family protein [Betaproteobacteria bacterium]NDA70491.1 YqgE/AlgH family protein [Betaproteobacteria bacterium]NDA72355.1 YqgE/AlgH family protein [Betaproteobacteria bacterium]